MPDTKPAARSRAARRLRLRAPRIARAFMTVPGASRRLARQRRARGFTFVELVLVIVIIGVLAAVALPRVLDMSRDARVAAVESLAGSIASAANLAHVRWAMTSGDMGGVTVDLGGGQLVYMWRGYPDAGNCCAPDGIEATLDISGFTLTQLDNQRSRYSHDKAPDPPNCSATYREAVNPGDRYAVTVVTTGC